MLNIVICDDDQKFVDFVEDTVEKYRCMEDLTDIRVELATTNQYEVLDLYVKKQIQKNGSEKDVMQPIKPRLFLLDVNFSDTFPHFNGYDLALEIRKYDGASRIAFITNELFEKRDVVADLIEPLGYIQKTAPRDEVVQGIARHIKTARERFMNTMTSMRTVEFLNGRGSLYYMLSDICLVQGNEAEEKDPDVEKCPSVLHLMNEKVALSRRIGIYDSSIPCLHRMGKSHLVNPYNIKHTHHSAKDVRICMKNGYVFKVTKEYYDRYRKELEARYKEGSI